MYNDGKNDECYSGPHFCTLVQNVIEKPCQIYFVCFLSSFPWAWHYIRFLLFPPWVIRMDFSPTCYSEKFQTFFNRKMGSINIMNVTYPPRFNTSLYLLCLYLYVCILLSELFENKLQASWKFSPEAVIYPLDSLPVLLHCSVSQGAGTCKLQSPDSLETDFCLSFSQWEAIFGNWMLREKTGFLLPLLCSEECPCQRFCLFLSKSPFPHSPGFHWGALDNS